MSSCEDIFGCKLACLRRQTSGCRPPALISIGRFWQKPQIRPKIGTQMALTLRVRDFRKLIVVI